MASSEMNLEQFGERASRDKTVVISWQGHQLIAVHGEDASGNPCSYSELLSARPTPELLDRTARATMDLLERKLQGMGFEHIDKSPKC